MGGGTMDPGVRHRVPRALVDDEVEAAGHPARRREGTLPFLSQADGVQRVNDVIFRQNENSNTKDIHDHMVLKKRDRIRNTGQTAGTGNFANDPNPLKTIQTPQIQQKSK